MLLGICRQLLSHIHPTPIDISDVQLQKQTRGAIEDLVRASSELLDQGTKTTNVYFYVYATTKLIDRAEILRTLTNEYKPIAGLGRALEVIHLMLGNINTQEPNSFDRTLLKCNAFLVSMIRDHLVAKTDLPHVPAKAALCLLNHTSAILGAENSEVNGDIVILANDCVSQVLEFDDFLSDEISSDLNAALIPLSEAKPPPGDIENIKMSIDKIITKLSAEEIGLTTL